MVQVLKFKEKMFSLENSGMALKGWVEQGHKLNHVCIHQYRFVSIIKVFYFMAYRQIFHAKICILQSRRL